MPRLLKWSLGIAGTLLILIVTLLIIVSGYDFNHFKPAILKAVYDSTGRELVIKSDIDLEAGLSPSLVLSDISFRNADWGTRKEMIKVDRLEIQVALFPLIKGNIEVKRFIIKDPDILIETNKEGKTNLEFKTADNIPAEKKNDLPVPENDMENSELPGLVINEFELAGGKITYRDGKTGKSEVIIIDTLTADIKGPEDPLNIDLKGAYNNYPLTVTGKLGSLRGINNPEIDWPLDLSIMAFGADLKISGTVKNPIQHSGINLDFDIALNDWKEIKKVSGQDIPLKERLSISGAIRDTKKDAYEINSLRVSIGNSAVDGNISLDISKKVPNLTVALASENLDLRQLITSDDKKAAESDAGKTELPVPENGKTKVFPDDQISFEALKQVDGNFKISFNKIILPQTIINKLTAEFKLDSGNLSASPVKAEIGGGIIDLNCSLLSGKNDAVLSVSLSVNGLELGTLLKEADITDMIDGTVEMDIDLKGKGNSVASIMAGLNGHTSFIMGEGRIHNKYIDLLGGDLSSGVFRLLNPSKEKKEYTAIRCAVNRLDITEGTADVTSLVLDTSMMSVIGEGSIELDTEKLDISLLPSAKGGVGGYSLSLGELAKPFKLSGTLLKPALSLDKKKTAIALGKAIGGNVLLGPAGIAAALVSKNSGKDENPCVSAIETAKTGEKDRTSDERKSSTTKQIIKDVIKDPGKTLKKLFGR